ncbi:MAG: DUF3006 domain-containing protein [Oscillospiraceae bacterium]|nr:DUF3006 domain-containing protein [Oscillospiraceae bacterium]
MANMAQSAYAVDRLEGSLAICECLETGAQITIETICLPANIKEGDILLQSGEGFEVDKIRTNQRRTDLTSRLNKLFGK